MRPASPAFPARLLRGVLAVAAALPLPAAAASLSEIYLLARANDAQLAATRQAALAGQEREAQSRAALLPSVVLSGNSRLNRDQSTAYTGRREYESNTVALTASQPLWRPASAKAYAQGQLQAQLAQQQLAQAEQALRLRIARAYFDVLQAEDALATLGAQKEAFAQQLAQAKRGFEVGVAPITDVSEAQARYDLTVAQEIAARNDLLVRRRTIEKSINGPLPPLDPLDPGAGLALLSAEQLAQLRDEASAGSLAVAAGETSEQIARLEVERQNMGHVFTVDLIGSAARNRNTNFGAFGGTNTYPKSIGVEVSFPLYQGGVVDSRIRESSANLNRARAEVDELRRQARLDADQALLGVDSGVALVQALQQAVASGETQVRATRRGFEVGVRNRVDVLNAEQQLFQTRRDLSAARYQALVSLLQLRAAAGQLGDDDLRRLDALLARR